VCTDGGLRGFSQLMQEALDGYLCDLEAGEIDELLGLEASSTSAMCGRGARRRTGRPTVKRVPRPGAVGRDGLPERAATR